MASVHSASVDVSYYTWLYRRCSRKNPSVSVCPVPTSPKAESGWILGPAPVGRAVLSHVSSHLHLRRTCTSSVNFVRHILPVAICPSHFAHCNLPIATCPSQLARPMPPAWVELFEQEPRHRVGRVGSEKGDWTERAWSKDALKDSRTRIPRTLPSGRVGREGRMVVCWSPAGQTEDLSARRRAQGPGPRRSAGVCDRAAGPDSAQLCCSLQCSGKAVEFFSIRRRAARGNKTTSNWENK